MNEVTPQKQDTEYTKRMKENYGFFGPATFLYAVFYAFCMFKNGSGITFPFFVAGSLLYLCFCLSKLEISLRKNSGFYMVSMMLLAVSVLNLIIVLVMMSYFKESKVLKVILTIMSLCTFVMIASSALRMIMYIRYYYMTFLRIFVLWALVVLFLMFVGVIVSVFKESFPLFKYCMMVITVLYIGLSFSHPDLIIAKINVMNTAQNDTNVIERTEDDLWKAGVGDGEFAGENNAKGFGYYYLQNLRFSCDEFSWRTYNISRHMALRNIEKYADNK